MNPIPSVSSTPISQISNDQASAAPFNKEWLAKSFNFDPSDVTKVKYNTRDYEVYFEKGKEAVAEQFFKVLTERGCYPQHWKFSNSVSLNVHLKDKILAAAKGGPPILEVEGKAAKPQISIEWLTEYFHIQPSQVKEIRDDKHDFRFGIEFKQEEEAELGPQEFFGALKKAGCNPTYYEHSHSVVIARSEEEKMRAHAEDAQTFNPPIKHRTEIDAELRSAIQLVQEVHKNLDHIRRVEKNNAAWQEHEPDEFLLNLAGLGRLASLRETGTSDYLKVESLKELIKENKDFIQDFLSNDELKQKLQYYFSTNENLMPKFESFTKRNMSRTV